MHPTWNRQRGASWEVDTDRTGSRKADEQEIANGGTQRKGNFEKNHRKSTNSPWPTVEGLAHVQLESQVVRRGNGVETMFEEDAVAENLLKDINPPIGETQRSPSRTNTKKIISGHVLEKLPELLSSPCHAHNGSPAASRDSGPAVPQLGVLRVCTRFRLPLGEGALVAAFQARQLPTQHGTG